MTPEKALAWLNSLAPLARVDRIYITDHTRPGKPFWSASSELWGYSFRDTPPNVVDISTTKFGLCLPKIAKAVHRSGQDTAQRRPNPETELDREVWERTMRSNPDLKPLPVMHLGPDTDPVWDPSTAQQDQATIAGFGRSVLLSRFRHGTLEEPDELWTASDGTAARGASPAHALLNLARRNF